MNRNTERCFLLTGILVCIGIWYNETGEMVLVECPVINGVSWRTKEILHKIILEQVHEGTTILTDGWAAYRSLPELATFPIAISM